MAKSKDLFEDWVDKAAISDLVFDTLEEYDPAQATFENAKTVWLDVLENLSELVEEAVDRQLH